MLPLLTSWEIDTCAVLQQDRRGTNEVHVNYANRFTPLNSKAHCNGGEGFRPIRPPIAIYMYLFLMFFNRKIKSIVFFFMNFLQKRKEQIKNKTLKNLNE